MKTINTYLAKGGLNPIAKTVVLTAYDYLDGGRKAYSDLSRLGLTPTPSSTITPRYPCSFAISALQTTPDLVYWGGHGNYNLVVTAGTRYSSSSHVSTDYAVAGFSSDHSGTGEISDLSGAAIFSSGCFNGVNFSNNISGGVYSGYDEFPEEYLGKGTIVYLGATGYTAITCNGDSENSGVTGFNELLAEESMRLFAAGKPAGEAFLTAAQNYYSQNLTEAASYPRNRVTLLPCGKRVLSVANLYGLPFYTKGVFGGYGRPPGQLDDVDFPGHVKKHVEFLPSLTLTPDGHFKANDQTELKYYKYNAKKDEPEYPYVTYEITLPPGSLGYVDSIVFNVSSSTYYDTSVPTIPVPTIGTSEETEGVEGHFSSLDYFPPETSLAVPYKRFDGDNEFVGVMVRPVQYRSTPTPEARVWEKLVFDVSIVYSPLTEATAVPSSIYADGVTSALLQVKANDVLGLCEVSTVTVDLSPLGGPPAAFMYDDGTHGDLNPGDKVFSREVTATFSGETTLEVQAQFEMSATLPLSNEATAGIHLEVQTPPGDTDPPWGSILINGGNEFTNQRGVTLSLSATDDATQVIEMRLANKDEDWSGWETFSSTKSWNLSSGDGEKKVYVEFKDANGNISFTSEDTITLDTNPPAGKIEINNDSTYTKERNVTLSLTYSDSLSGVDKVRYKNEGGSWTAWEAPTLTKTWTLSSGEGTKTVYYEIRDKAGNTSIYSDSIVFHTPTSQRIYGTSRIETAIEISKKAFSSSDYVVIATGYEFPDALAGAPLAYAYNAPLLLVKPTSLPNEVRKELQRLNAKNVFILGGNLAVSSEVENSLRNMGLNVSRIAGKSRYETAKKIAEKIREKEGDPERVIVTRGDNFPDALSSSSYAAKKGYPILLTKVESLSEETKDFLKSLKSKPKAIILGGNLAVSSSVEKELKGILGSSSVERISGSNRIETGVKIAEKALSQGFSPEYPLLSTGYNYPDALAGGVLGAKLSSPILLTSPEHLSDETESFLSQRKDEVVDVYILGGDLALSNQVEDEVDNIIK